MNCKLYVSENFRRESKRLIKKYSSLSLELNALQSKLYHNPHLGTPIGNQCYKVRLSVKSKGKGKRGGLRIITWVVIRVIKEINTTIVSLLSIYDKSEYESINDKFLREIIKEIKTELNI